MAVARLLACCLLAAAMAPKLASAQFEMPPLTSDEDRPSDPVAATGIAGLLMASDAPFPPDAFETRGSRRWRRP